MAKNLLLEYSDELAGTNERLIEYYHRNLDKLTKKRYTKQAGIKQTYNDILEVSMKKVDVHVIVAMLATLVSILTVMAVMFMRFFG